MPSFVLNAVSVPPTATASAISLVFSFSYVATSPEFKAFQQICAICRTPEELVGDHDHKTGKPRGILCRNCNLAIGNMHDEPRRLRAAADYIERTL